MTTLRNERTHRGHNCTSDTTMTAHLAFDDRLVTVYTTSDGQRSGPKPGMSSNVIPLRRVESIRMNFLRMGAAGHSLQAALAIWFDLLHKRSAEDREACILALPEIANDRSVVFARSGSAAPTETIFVGRELTRTLVSIAAETVRGVSLATPIAFTHEWGRDRSVNSLVLPFGHPHRAVAVVFDW